jgi:hypothetical protein
LLAQRGNLVAPEPRLLDELLDLLRFGQYQPPRRLERQLQQPPTSSLSSGRPQVSSVIARFARPTSSERSEAISSDRC